MRAVTLIAMTAAMDLLTAFFTMLFIGAAHSHDERVPAFGFVVSLWLVLALSGIVTLALGLKELREL